MSISVAGYQANKTPFLEVLPSIPDPKPGQTGKTGETRAETEHANEEDAREPANVSQGFSVGTSSWLFTRMPWFLYPRNPVPAGTSLPMITFSFRPRR
jgi:hypothetical protein